MALKRGPMVSVLPPCCSRSEEKAIHSLSGDQFGIVSVHSPSVKRRRYFSSPSLASIIHRFLCPLRPDLKTMYFPSGEILGKALFFVPGFVSNVTARFFSPGFKSIVSTSLIARMCTVLSSATNEGPRLTYTVPFLIGSQLHANTSCSNTFRIPVPFKFTTHNPGWNTALMNTIMDPSGENAGNAPSTRIRDTWGNGDKTGSR